MSSSRNGLAAVQQQFQAQVLRGEPGVETLVVATAAADRAQRLAVYSQAYRLRLLEVLSKDYPALRRLVGARQFERLGRAYIEAHPSTTPSIRWFGRHLAVFLREQAPYMRRTVLAEMAEFEWRQGEAFDAPDAPVIGVAEIAAIPAAAWPQLRLAMHPSLRRLELKCNVPALWQALHAKRKSPRPRACAAPASWILWRRELTVRWRSLEPDEAAALNAAAAGRTFAAVCTRVADRTEPAQAALRAASLLKRWAGDGLICAIDNGERV